MAVNIVTGSMLKGLREAGCRITTICKYKGYRHPLPLIGAKKLALDHLQEVHHLPQDCRTNSDSDDGTASWNESLFHNPIHNHWCRLFRSVPVSEGTHSKASHHQRIHMPVHMLWYQSRPPGTGLRPHHGSVHGVALTIHIKTRTSNRDALR